MPTGYDEHLKHLNTSSGRIGVVVEVEYQGVRGEKENNSGESGVQGVFSQVDVTNTMPTRAVASSMVFGGDGA